MAAQAAVSPIPHSREVRLGLVMYGGVSLAVYENGVAQELFRAVKGEGVYRLLKAFSDSDIVVDILSGTSAGGINGILLAYALANGKDFRTCARLWRVQGDILQLLRDAKDQSTVSVLNSEGFYQPALEQAFAEMPDYGNSEPAYESEIDLFVTGTDVHGRVFTEFDDQGHPIDVKDHRAVFMLSYRPERKNEFKPKPENIKALAKLARITSCFPVAFAPVFVSDPDLPERAGMPEGETDCLLKRWGQLQHEAYYLDGGLLDNKPFSYTIGAIFGRTAERAVDRMLLYVEPDPERFTDDVPRQSPSVVEAAMDALISIPGYESIAGDLQNIAERNSKLAHVSAARQAVGVFNDGVDFLADSNPNDLAILNNRDQRGTNIYFEARLSQLRDRCIEGLLKSNGVATLLRGDRRHAAKMLVDSFESWPAEGVDTLREFDVYFRLRRLYQMSYAIRDFLRASHEKHQPVEDALYLDIRHRLNNQIKIYEMLRWAMETVIDQANISIDDILSMDSKEIASRKWQQVRTVLRRLLQRDLPLPSAGVADWKYIEDPERHREEQQQRWEFMEGKGRLRDRVRSLKGDRGVATDAEAGFRDNLLTVADRQDRMILNNLLPLGSRLRLEYCNFALLDSYVFPMEQLSGLEARDVIRTVRVSPLDAQRGYSKGTVDDKICGNELAHFGGFLKQSWRANDIMVGRLDGLCQLTECILTPERILQLGQAHINNAATSVNLASIFPNSPKDEIDSLGEDFKNLERFARDHLTGPPSAADRSNFDLFLDRWVKMAQREILQEEIPRVLESSIDQQVQWNQYQVEASISTNPFRAAKQAWKTGIAKLDTAIASFAKGQMANESRISGSWSSFYDNKDYQVGKEKFRGDVPVPIMLEIFSRAALSLKNCLAGAADEETAKKIRSNPLFRFGIEYPLQGIHRFVELQRTAPEEGRALQVALVTLSLASLIVFGIWNPGLLKVGEYIQLGRFATFILAPVLILGALLFLYGILKWVFYLIGSVAVALVSALLLLQFGWVTIDSIRATFLPGTQLQHGILAIFQTLDHYRIGIWIGLAAALIGSAPIRGAIEYIRRKLKRPTQKMAEIALPPQPEDKAAASANPSTSNNRRLK